MFVCIQIFGVDNLDLNRCCAKTADIPNIDIGGTEIPMQVQYTTHLFCSLQLQGCYSETG